MNAPGLLLSVATACAAIMVNNPSIFAAAVPCAASLADMVNGRA